MDAQSALRSVEDAIERSTIGMQELEQRLLLLFTPDLVVTSVGDTDPSYSVADRIHATAHIANIECGIQGDCPLFFPNAINRLVVTQLCVVNAS